MDSYLHSTHLATHSRWPAVYSCPHDQEANTMPFGLRPRSAERIKKIIPLSHPKRTIPTVDLNLPLQIFVVSQQCPHEHALVGH